jgi:F0F1-type ATP synthase assembly protein I
VTERPTRSHFAAGQKQAVEVLALAAGFAAAVALFWLLGLGVDRWLEVRPWGQITGVFAGWGAGFLHVYYWTRGRQ